MAVRLKLYVEDADEFQDLSAWMTGHTGVSVDAVAGRARPNAQGTVWDFLSVTCEAGGPVVVAVRALQLWIQARVTTVEVVVGDRRIKVRSRDAATVLPQVVEATRALAAAETPDAAH